jgi:hypothetical protein
MAERLGSALPTQLPGFDSPYPLHFFIPVTFPWGEDSAVNGDVLSSNLRAGANS